MMQIVRLLMVYTVSLGILLQPTLARSSENWFVPKPIAYENRLPVNHFRYQFTQEFADQYKEYAISQLSLIGDLSDNQIDEIEAEYKFWKSIIEAVKIAIDLKTIQSMSAAQIANFLNDPDFLQVILNVLDRAGLILPDESDAVFKEAILVIAKLYFEILKTLPKNVPFTTDMVKLTKKVNATGSVTFWIGIGADIAGITNAMVYAVQLKKVTNVMYSHLIAYEFIKAHVCPKWEDNSSIFYLEGTPLSCDYQHYEEFIASTYDDYADEYGGVGFSGVNAINSDGDLIKYTAGGVFKLYSKIPNKKGGSSLEDWYNSLNWTDYAIYSPGNYDVSLATSVIETYYGLNNATNYSIILLDGDERLLNDESYDDLRAGDEIKITTPFHNQIWAKDEYSAEILAFDFYYKVADISIYKVNSDLSEELITGKKQGIKIFPKVTLRNGENIFKEEIELFANDEENPIIVTRYFFININKNKGTLTFMPSILSSIKKEPPLCTIGQIAGVWDYLSKDWANIPPGYLKMHWYIIKSDSSGAAYATDKSYINECWPMCEGNNGYQVCNHTQSLNITLKSGTAEMVVQRNIQYYTTDGAAPYISERQIKEKWILDTSSCSQAVMLRKDSLMRSKNQETDIWSDWNGSCVHADKIYLNKRQ